ncbi:MAG: PIN domain-containing protein [Actinomycetota bacterium]|nr:PIN domain-containing protein [Actinomycetota bacterium]
MSVLLDGSVLVALAFDDHVHFDAAHRWLDQQDEPLASCPVTEGTLLRLAIRAGARATQAKRLLGEVLADHRHEFWPDEISYGEVPLTGVIGHRQVTDAYLAQLARIRGGRLATFDQGLAELHRDVAELVPI